MDIKVIEPIKEYLKEFNSPDEFNIFYTKNKDSIDQLTTHKLNKMYHIVGYRITRIKGNLMLKKWNESKTRDDNPQTDITDAHQIHDEIEEMKTSIASIKDTVNEIIQYLNSITGQPRMNTFSMDTI